MTEDPRLILAVDKINCIIDLITVAILANECCVDKSKPISVLNDFAIPALEDLRELLE